MYEKLVENKGGFDHLDEMNFWIEIGINLSTQDKYGLTPLHYGNSIISKIFK